MGAQMTKELGVYNEEEKISTPISTPIRPQCYRMLCTDPRSVTRGIIRTPIQVVCTPISAKEVLSDGENVSVDKADCSYTDLSEETDCGNNDEIEVHAEEEVKKVCEEEEGLVKPPYLETNIDSPAAVVSCIKELEDVRSPTLNLARTPVLVECTPELFMLHSRINSMSFCDVEGPADDPSVIVSDDETTSLHSRSHVNNWLVAVENQPAETPGCNSSFAESPKTVAKKQKELNLMKKQLFFTPDVKELVKPKVRTPLGNIQQGQLRESPQKMMRAKQWRNIQEERQRRGITDTENTPPNLNLPPLSQVSSAPGKMLVKRTKINWDEDTLVI